MMFEIDCPFDPATPINRAMTRRFPLRVLFTLTGFVALFAFGISVANNDIQTGLEIALFAICLTLAWIFFDIPAVVWAGMITGFALGAIRYWWNGTYYEVVPADRLFEFVVSTIWHSIAGGFLSVASWALLRRVGRLMRYLLSGRDKNSDGST